MTDEPKIDQAAQMLDEYRKKNALKNGDYKQLFEQYFEAADEYTTRTGKQPPPIVFNLVAK